MASTKRSAKRKPAVKAKAAKTKVQKRQPIPISLGARRNA